MSSFINWIDDKKKSTYVLVGVLLISYAATMIFQEPWLAVVAAIASIICPFALLLVWIVDTAWIEKLLQRRWTAILIGGGLIVYGMVANTFASDLINDHFKVDPTHFTVTTIFLTTAYLLVGVFQPFVMVPLWLTTIVLGGFILPALVLTGAGLQPLKRVGLFFLATVLISASTQSLGIFHYQLPLLVEQVALRADFNEKHRCTAKWPVEVDKVVFLHDGNVLAHITGTRNYEIFPCFGTGGSNPSVEGTLRGKAAQRP